MGLFADHSDPVPVEAGVRRDWRRGRLELTWVGGERGIPSINADIQNATEATRMTADPDFEIKGTSASTDDVTHNAEGGLTLQTDNTDDDQVILIPHQDANQTPWSKVTWGTDQETRYEAFIEMENALANRQVMVGLKIDLDMTLNDDDLIMFHYDPTDDSDTTWGVVANVGKGTAVDIDTGIQVTMGARYKFVIEFDAGEVAHCYINDELVAEIDFMGNTVDLKPLIGLLAHSTNEPKLVLYEQKIGRNYA